MKAKLTPDVEAKACTQWQRSDKYNLQRVQMARHIFGVILQ